VRLDRLL